MAHMPLSSCGLCVSTSMGFHFHAATAFGSGPVDSSPSSLGLTSSFSSSSSSSSSDVSPLPPRSRAVKLRSSSFLTPSSARSSLRRISTAIGCRCIGSSRVSPAARTRRFLLSWVGLVVITLGPPSPPVCLVGLSATCAPWRCTRRVACVAVRLPSFALVGAIAVASAAPAARTGSRVTEAVTALVSTLTGGWRAARMESASAALCSAFSLTDKAFDMSKESPALRTPEGAVTAPNGALCEVLVRFRRGAVAAPPLGIVGSKEFLIRVCCSLACAGLVRSPVSGIPVEVSSAGAEHFGSEVVCVVVALVESRMPHATLCYDDGLSLLSHRTTCRDKHENLCKHCVCNGNSNGKLRTSSHDVTARAREDVRTRWRARVPTRLWSPPSAHSVATWYVHVRMRPRERACSTWGAHSPRNSRAHSSCPPYLAFSLLAVCRCADASLHGTRAPLLQFT